MAKRALFAVAGFLGLCFPLSAQQADPVFSALNNNPLRFPSLMLSDGKSFSFAEAVASSLSFNWIETLPPADVSLPAVIVRQPRRVAIVSTVPGTDSSKEIVDVQQPKLFDYAGGEVGFLYGVSSGKYGGTFEQGYILGEVGNDKFQISAGASYEHSSGRVPRFGR